MKHLSELALSRWPTVFLCILSACYVLANGLPCTTGLTSYDIIVVGGGTAGLAVATRLSQRLTTSCILVVEAGQDGRADPRIYQPGRKGSTMGTMYDWNLTTVPQPDASNRKFAMTRGKVLGGSSALNLMTWDRASRDDYDSWEILGNPGWDFKNMVAAMLKVEDFFPTPEYQGPGTGTSGIIQTLINRIYPKQQLPFIPVLNDFGVPTNLASLDGDPIGVMRQPSNIREDNYTRSYSPAYLEFAGRNLIIKLNTRVAKINIVDGLATGITLEDGSVIAARKEVILSAGSLLSPALLELSGVGQAAVLAAAGVPLLVDLPGVGENLQDHIRIQSSYQLKPAYEYAFDRLRYNTTYQAQQLALYDTLQPSEYDYTGSGYSYSNWAPTGAANVAKLLALAEQASDGSAIDKRKLAYLKDTSLNTKVPQLEVIFSDGYTGVKGYPANGTALYGAEFFALIASIQHPFSKGTVHISSANLSIAPTIDPNYLSKSYDLVAAATAAKFLRQLATSSFIAPIWTSEYDPGPSVATDADWVSFARNTTLSIYHPVGTCAMLPKQDGGVVDPDLKVYGVRGLRVVDSSVIPILLSAHIQTAVYAIAERAANTIIDDWS